MGSVSEKPCSKCGKVFAATPEFFYRRRGAKDGLTAACKPCTEIPRTKEAIPSEHKRCGRCQRVKPAAEFHRAQGRKDGLYGFCKECTTAAVLNYRSANRELMCERQKQYVAANPEKVRKQKRAYYEGNKEAHSHYTREWARANPEKVSAYRRRYREANPEKLKALGRAYREKFPEKNATKERRRRALKCKVGGSHTAEDVLRQFEAQKRRCWWCGKRIAGTDYHVDHRIPLVKGGSNGAENIVIAHPTCNLRKQAKMPWEFMEGRLL